MKKRFLSLLLALLLLTLLLPAAFAEGGTQGIIVLPPEETPAQEAGAPEESALPPEETPAQEFLYVFDNAGLLLDSQREALEQKAAALSEQHRCSLYIVTVEDHRSISSDIVDAAQKLFLDKGFGWGSGKDGVILMLSMNERDFDLDGHGDKGETICGYESRWLIEDVFLDNFRSDDWYGGFEDYLERCDTQLTKLENGEDITEGAEIIQGPDGLDYHEYNNPYAEQKRSILPRLLAVILIPCLIAVIVCSVFRAQMKTAHEAVDADEYLVPHSINLRIRQDRFTHRTESRTLIQSDSGPRGGGSSGGGSSFHSGGGFSGSSGKF